MTTVTRSVQFGIQGGRRRAVGADESRPEKAGGRVPRISKLMALAIRYDRMLSDGVVQNQTELAQLLHVSQPRMTQIMNLLHLSPEIQGELLFMHEQVSGRDRVCERYVRPLTRMYCWSEQQAAWQHMIDSGTSADFRRD